MHPHTRDDRTIEVDGLDALTHKPLVVLTELDPWRTVIGSDVPTTVLYEDGTVVSHRGTGNATYAWTARAPQAVNALARRIASSDVMTLPVRWSVLAATDQPTVRLLVRSGSRWKYTEVYGIRRDGKPAITNNAAPDAPSTFVDAYRALLDFEVDGAVPWTPEQIEIMLWDFSHTKKRPRPWPREIPTPAYTKPTQSKGVFKHVVDGRLEPAVKEFLSSLEPAQAVSLGNHTLSMAYRRRVPEEEYIMRVRDCARVLKVAADAGLPPAGCR